MLVQVSISHGKLELPKGVKLKESESFSLEIDIPESKLDFTSNKHEEAELPFVTNSRLKEKILQLESLRHYKEALEDTMADEELQQLGVDMKYGER